jgi:hypothetical protein
MIPERIGWVKLHRKYLDNPVWRNDAANRVFLWLLLAARRTAGRERYGKREIAVDRGQVAVSQRSIALATGLSRKQVRMALGFLADEGVVSIGRPFGPGRNLTLIGVEKYSLHQGEETGAVFNADRKAGPIVGHKKGPIKRRERGHDSNTGNLFSRKEMEESEDDSREREKAWEGPIPGPEKGTPFYKWTFKDYAAQISALTSSS